jgi:uncharacterized protein
MYLERRIDFELTQWKKENKRKPLIIRGARQVGKSSSVRHLAKSFKYFIELNFEENPYLKTIFENSTHPDEICEQLSVFTNTPIIEGETLIFMDEIQNCIEAITSLRYFYEKRNNLHVIAAGSLLEFALSKVPSFAVGRVRSLFVFPFSFEEFLGANGETVLVDLLRKSNTKKPIPEIIHLKLIRLLKLHIIIGGMPEVVSTYINTKDLLEVQKVLNDLVITMQEDFLKYDRKTEISRIIEVFNSVVSQIGNKFTYSYPNATLTNIQIKNILEILIKAGLIYPITHSAANGIPLGAEVNIKKRKYLFFDTGLYQRILNLDLSRLMIENEFSTINKGNIAEAYVGLELLKNRSPYEKSELNYWQRESKNSQAEVDYVIQKHDLILPVEVKAGTKGSMQSLYLFLKEKNLSIGIRTSLENFSEFDNLKIIPIYSIGLINSMELS